MLEPYLDAIIELGEVGNIVDRLIEQPEEEKWGLALQDKLNPYLWDGMKLRSDIRKHLIDIAEGFFEDDKDKATLTDLAITGSLANYNWSRFSDIDLHVVVKFGKHHELKKRLFALKALLWNEHHAIKLKGHEVEIYVQELSEPHYSTGVYSLTKDEWIKKPSKFHMDIDMRAVVKKAVRIVTAFKQVEHLVAKHRYPEALAAAHKLHKRMKKQRKAGLEQGGEMSIENLAYKLARRRGVLDKLTKLRRKAYDCVAGIDGCK